MERREQPVGHVVTFIELRSTSAGTIWRKDGFCLGLVECQMPVCRCAPKGHLFR